MSKNTERRSNYVLDEIGITNDQLLKMHEYLFASGYFFPDDYMSSFGENIDLIKEIVSMSPELYMQLSKELKKNEEVIMSALGDETEKIMPYFFDFYSVLGKNEDKLEAFKEVFGDFTYNRFILKHLIFEEYMEDDTFVFLNECKEDVLNDDNLLDMVLMFIGLEGFLGEFKDDYDFIKRIVNINGRYLSFASERLKRDRYLMMQAIKKCPQVVCELMLDDDDPLLKLALESSASSPLISNWQLESVIRYFEAHADILMVELDEVCVKYLLNAFKYDVNTIKSILNISPNSYLMFNDEMKRNKEIVKHVLKNNNLVILDDIVSSDNKEELMKERFGNLLDDDDTFKKICIYYSYNYKLTDFLVEYFKDRLLDDEQLLKEIIDNYNFKYLCKHIMNNYELIRYAITLDGSEIVWVADEYREDKDLIKLAIKTYPELIFDKRFDIDEELYNYGIDIFKDRGSLKESDI